MRVTSPGRPHEAGREEREARLLLPRDDAQRDAERLDAVDEVLGVAREPQGLRPDRHDPLGPELRGPLLEGVQRAQRVLRGVGVDDPRAEQSAPEPGGRDPVVDDLHPLG